MAKKKELVDVYTEVGLPEFAAVGKKEKDNGDILYILKPLSRPSACPQCGASTLYVHKPVTRNAQDLDMFGHRVGLQIVGSSYRCKECEALLRPDYPSLSGRMTTRLVDAIQKDSLRDTFADVARRYHVSSTSVATIFSDYADRCMLQHKFVAPSVLGIDEVHLEDDYRGVFVSVSKSEGRVLEFTEKRTYPSVVATLRSMEEPWNLKLVTMDMWKPYKDAVNTVFPDIPIVIDHFHVIKNLICAMDVVRANICKGIKAKDRKVLKRNRFLMLRDNEDLPANQGKALQGIFKEYPELENLYLLKEAFRDIYRDAKSSTEAIKMFDEWCDACEDCGTHAYDAFIQTVLAWKNEIFAYFDYPDLERTNAQTESLNRAIRTIARNGRGYKFDILRKKVILSRYRFEQEERFSFSDFFDE